MIHVFVERREDSVMNASGSSTTSFSASLPSKLVNSIMHLCTERNTSIRNCIISATLHQTEVVTFAAWYSAKQGTKWTSTRWWNDTLLAILGDNWAITTIVGAIMSREGAAPIRIGLMTITSVCDSDRSSFVRAILGGRHSAETVVRKMQHDKYEKGCKWRRYLNGTNLGEFPHSSFAVLQLYGRFRTCLLVIISNYESC